ncbi:pyridine nucleotide-disulfide oxidoreductase [delta proteobacterium NaphS2]|nr:pyridine nucleotide-disulfide oxidoreductase [delta proteobacterium NaphS2]
MRYVIAGNGIAGISAAEAIRQLDPSGPITMVGDEKAVPYSRPMISMVLDGSIPFEKLPIRVPSIYEDLNIETRFGNRITAIDVADHEIMLLNRQSIPFDRLLIATGADARQIQATHAHLKNIHYLRTRDHVRQIVDQLPETRRPLVLGGGLVGFKAAYGLLKRGLKPTMLISSAYPLSMQVDETAGKIILDELVRNGLTVRVGISVTAFEGNEAVSGAQLSDGSILPCDLVIAGKGVMPSLGFVPREKILTDLGILVDEHLETSLKGVYAAGDVAECVDIARKRRWVNAIWPEAAAQGRTAGMNMAGRDVSYTGSVSRNVMRIFGLDLMTLGLANPEPDSHCRILSSHDLRNNRYRKLVFRENVLVGAVLLGHIEQGGLLLALIHNETPISIPREKLLEPGFNFRQLMN